MTLNMRDEPGEKRAGGQGNVGRDSGPAQTGDLSRREAGRPR
jgi:hypothetical protein